MQKSNCLSAKILTLLRITKNKLKEKKAERTTLYKRNAG